METLRAELPNWGSYLFYFAYFLSLGSFRRFAVRSFIIVVAIIIIVRGNMHYVYIVLAAAVVDEMTVQDRF